MLFPSYASGFLFIPPSSTATDYSLTIGHLSVSSQRFKQRIHMDPCGSTFIHIDPQHCGSASYLTWIRYLKRWEEMQSGWMKRGTPTISEMSGRGRRSIKGGRNQVVASFLDFPLVRSVFCAPAPTSWRFQPTAVWTPVGLSNSLQRFLDFQQFPMAKIVKINLFLFSQLF